ncbi:MAG TPA: TerD family protein [Methanosarcina sp.]|nr:TerD family protein [Methanosarcina sp.]
MSNDILDLTKTTDALDLTKARPSLKKLKGVLAWDKVNNTSAHSEFDMDIWVFCLDKDGKIGGQNNIVFFNHKEANGFSIPRDEREGGNKPEEMFADLLTVPSNIQSADIFVIIHEAVPRQQTFGMVSKATFTLIDDEKGDVIQSYRINDHVGDIALHVGSLIRQNGGWAFDPIGQSGTMNPNEIYNAYK